MDRKALCRLKAAGIVLRLLLADTLTAIRYKPTKADPDVWLWPTVKVNGFEYYELVLCYVDDFLLVSDNSKATLLDLTAVFKVKDDTIKPSKRVYWLRRTVQL